MPLGPYNRMTPGRARNAAALDCETTSPLSYRAKTTRLKKPPVIPLENRPLAENPVYEPVVVELPRILQSDHPEQRSSLDRPSRIEPRQASLVWKSIRGFGSGNVSWPSSFGSVVSGYCALWLALALKRPASTGKNTGHRHVILDWQGDYNVLLDHSARPQSTTFYPEPAYHLPVPTPRATAVPEKEVPSEVRPFYDPRYDPFDLRPHFFEPEEYFHEGRPYALKIHLKPTQDSTALNGARPSKSKCRGARTRC
ncbi:hypothetical protein GLOTRDRAFT_129913 [Gloeophyllum trabeum ATCC 11539]|uniref:Uncharacterized protein n=1 Tax=Gloeophyllum trabeum (strain ATCC 11539 / FP-39264 / Madison 617) TaxID=670483 RepID=S7Q4W6_GLOTA|nr:uncharacterized protein GLOTRDRAFT_129913 [Gloeophyllum trabeum ATCC 11539]EPQ54563.1 hypothetical protein GLOTRDRAFT_129913 [Gloeophyllum trabeum ATCC 11539]